MGKMIHGYVPAAVKPQFGGFEPAQTRTRPTKLRPLTHQRFHTHRPLLSAPAAQH
jgi:hypothetical protein